MVGKLLGLRERLVLPACGFAREKRKVVPFIYAVCSTDWARQTHVRLPAPFQHQQQYEKAMRYYSDDLTIGNLQMGESIEASIQALLSHLKGHCRRYMLDG
jgi:hypothetical protein